MEIIIGKNQGIKTKKNEGKKNLCSQKTKIQVFFNPHRLNISWILSNDS